MHNNIKFRCTITLNSTLLNWWYAILYNKYNIKLNINMRTPHSDGTLMVSVLDHPFFAISCRLGYFVHRFFGTSFTCKGLLWAAVTIELGGYHLCRYRHTPIFLSPTYWQYRYRFSLQHSLTYTPSKKLKKCLRLSPFTFHSGGSLSLSDGPLCHFHAMTSQCQTESSAYNSEQ